MNLDSLLNNNIICERVKRNIKRDSRNSKRKPQIKQKTSNLVRIGATEKKQEIGSSYEEVDNGIRRNGGIFSIWRYC